MARSFQDILKSMVDSVMTTTKVEDISAGSVLDTLLRDSGYSSIHHARLVRFLAKLDSRFEKLNINRELAMAQRYYEKPYTIPCKKK